MSTTNFLSVVDQGAAISDHITASVFSGGTASGGTSIVSVARPGKLSTELNDGLHQHTAFAVAPPQPPTPAFAQAPGESILSPLAALLLIVVLALVAATARIRIARPMFLRLH